MPTAQSGGMTRFLIISTWNGSKTSCFKQTTSSHQLGVFQKHLWELYSGITTTSTAQSGGITGFLIISTWNGSKSTACRLSLL